MMIKSTIPLVHLVLVHLDYLWVPAHLWAHFHLSLQVDLVLPLRKQRQKNNK